MLCVLRGSSKIKVTFWCVNYLLMALNVNNMIYDLNMPILEHCNFHAVSLHNELSKLNRNLKDLLSFSKVSEPKIETYMVKLCFRETVQHHKSITQLQGKHSAN